MKINLVDLEPQFVRYETRVTTWTEVTCKCKNYPKCGHPNKEVTGPKVFTIPVHTFAEAQGIWFHCPLCYSKNNTLVGVHQVEVTFRDRGTLPEQGSHNSKGEPVRWAVSGKGFSDLFVDPSILLEGGCNWHGFLKNGICT